MTRPYRPRIFAHRGSSARFAEHTRAAYLQALADGADGVECDVHLTKDERIVLLHDPTLERTSNGTGPVAAKTLAELRDLDFASWKGTEIPAEYGTVEEQLLTLEELMEILASAGRPVRLALELKHPSPFGLRLEERVLECLMGLGWDPETSTLGNVTISFMSFDPDSVQHLAETVPEEHLCMLIQQVDSASLQEIADVEGIRAQAVSRILRRAASLGERLITTGRAGVAGPGVDYVLAHEPRVSRWIQGGITLRVWTVDHPGHVALMRQLGVQEITTNMPAEVRQQLLAS
ncbi:glycerophosphodiester phosphodiesterase [Falsarthrobacter nasiphocae]|uniref:Glycerophosphoryl diester phosphodiesterase n=1 Tax=Falsarthrobacter nasiphocae TaxID=189863 RepID=A0AAE4C535_9MICC|nr:glycerophosphodiester phosphodiesterase family protein [Falsarthrobacter nasiphocae]MDR6891936.1 glycerophosphoryl diester phosphodiesterase [Falsarthrobacter nasiphocae]